MLTIANTNLYVHIAHNKEPRLGQLSLVHTGFPLKDARFPKLKNIPDLLSDDKEGKIKNNDLKYFSNRASFMGNPVGRIGLRWKPKAKSREGKFWQIQVTSYECLGLGQKQSEIT